MRSYDHLMGFTLRSLYRRLPLLCCRIPFSSFPALSQIRFTILAITRSCLSKFYQIFSTDEVDY